MSHVLQQPTLILTLKSVEIYQRFNDSTFPVTSGPLSVFYFLQSNTFVIQTNNFSYTLSKDNSIYASPPHHGQLYPSYIFPAHESYFILRITEVASPEALSSFESLLNNNSHLSYREEPEIGLTELIRPHEAQNLENEPLIQLDQQERQQNKHCTEKTSNFITKGGELARMGFIWTGELVSRGIAKLGGFVESKCTRIEEKEVKPSIANKLSIADSATQTAFNFTRTQAVRLLQVRKVVEQKILDSELNHKFEQSKYHDSVSRVGMSTLYAAACAYDGYMNAMILIGRGIRDTTVHAVSNKYGEQVGDATKRGFHAIGNIGKIATIYKEEISGWIESQYGNQHSGITQQHQQQHAKAKTE